MNPYVGVLRSRRVPVKSDDDRDVATDVRLPRMTGTLGLTGQGNLGPVGGLVSGGIAVDSNGELVGYGTLGRGVALSKPRAGVTFGVTAGGNNGLVRDQRGEFDTSSLSGGDELAFGVDRYRGTGADGRPVNGGSATVGVGGGVTAFGGKTRTWITRPVKVEDLLYGALTPFIPSRLLSLVPSSKPR